MFNLQRIKGIKSQGGDYLGIAAGFMIEVRDNDPALHKLLPPGVNFKISPSPAYRGSRRLNLLNYSGTCLVTIRSGQVKAGIQQAKLELYINNGYESDMEVLAMTRILASYRWPAGILLVTKSALKKMPKALPSALIAAGWIKMSDKPGKVAYHILLPNLKVT